MNSHKTFIQPILTSRSYKVLKERMAAKRTQAITMTILTFAGLSIFGVFAISPTVATIAQLKRQLADKQEVNQKLQTKIQNLTSLQQQYIVIEKDLSIIDSTLPNKPNLALIIGQLHAVAKNSNLTVSQIQITNIPLKTNPSLAKNTNIAINPTKISFSLSAEGSYADIKVFLENLSQLNRIITVQDISTSEKTSTVKAIQLNLTGDAFYIP